MLLDNQAIFSDQQVITNTANSTNVIDLNAMGEVSYSAVAGAKPTIQRRLGIAHVLPLLVQVTEDFTGALSTIDFILQEDSADDFSVAPRDVLTIQVPVAELEAGYILPMDKLPREVRERYLRLRYVLDNTATTGKITAGFTNAVDGGYKGIVV